MKGPKSFYHNCGGRDQDVAVLYLRQPVHIFKPLGCARVFVVGLHQAAQVACSADVAFQTIQPEAFHDVVID